ncbi:TetR/AcrR family transcriptional regulator [Xylophilus sp.]|uniref:TetR/AcrR family transcriptional regulator n=1 Tax=Xylophilus sp. TaxID=2653893 RepID=UPI0013B6C525|nr:TetR/AcrR family transcriptional regulator [Xylophilus sp.]KAF1042799.1 MAG: HTH-type transcriptional dual regulator CecR [Xylophilus sp.]
MRPAVRPAPRAGAAGAADPVRQRRADGDATRAGTVEAAGRLFAQRGYAGTTGKAICERAGVNLAAINYHFGGRDGLYLAVLKEVHHRFMSMEFLRQLATNALPAPDKLRSFFRELVGHILAGDDWTMQVWAREVLSPSPLLDTVFRQDTQPKFEAVSAIVGGITGIDPADPRMPQLVLGVVAPCLVLLIVDRGTAAPIRPLFSEAPDALADGLWRFALGGLAAARDAPQPAHEQPPLPPF